MEDVRRIKTQLTNASGGIEAARQLLDVMAAGVRGHLSEIELLLAAAGAAASASRGWTRDPSCRRRRAPRTEPPPLA